MAVHYYSDGYEDDSDTNLDAIKTAIEILDNIVSGNEAQVDLVGSIPAGEAHVGQVGGAETIIKIAGATVAVGAAIYASGDMMGTKLTIANALRVSGGSGFLQSVIIHDYSKQKAALDIILFDADPSATTFTDNAALTLDDADLNKIIGVVKVLPSDYIDFAASSVAVVRAIGLPIKVASGTTIYGATVCRGTPTYTANELALALGFMQD